MTENAPTNEFSNVTASLATVFTVRAQGDPEFPFAVNMLISDNDKVQSHFSIVDAHQPHHTIIRLPLGMLEAFAGMLGDASTWANMRQHGNVEQFIASMSSATDAS